MVEESGRKAILIYAGDFDPSGEDILRDFVVRAACFDDVLRVAVNAGQIEELGLPEMPGKSTDSRAGGFTARHGRLVQVELEAIDPDVLHDLYALALGDFWDVSKFEDVRRQEEEGRARLVGLAGELG